jgi:hypothetical protein
MSGARFRCMAHQNVGTSLLCVCAAIALGSSSAIFADEANIENRFRVLEQQNEQLLLQVRKQQELIEALSRQVTVIRESHSTDTADNPRKQEAMDTVPDSSGISAIKQSGVHISGEGGVGFVTTGSEGFAPHSQFRVDEARLFIEAPLWKDVYFYGETDLATRENVNLNLKLGELYLDAQDVSQLWGHAGQLNIRLGRMNIPFGEEYLTRYAISNPLISHSLSDLWGFDQGVELYGGVGKFSYAVAAQNGSGVNGVEDFTGDKSVAGRIGYDPAGWLHVSLSGMRTGDVSSQQDKITALWFGSGFFRSLGSPMTTSFHASLVEGDVNVRWRTGHLNAFGGFARYGDNDPLTDNARNVFYYSVEGVQQLPSNFYLAARFSEILSAGGLPIAGNGDFGNYFFTDLTTRLWRLSVGLGYRFSDHLILKTEYSFEQGRELNGDSRDHEDLFGTEAVFQF